MTTHGELEYNVVLVNMNDGNKHTGDEYVYVRCEGKDAPNEHTTGVFMTYRDACINASWLSRHSDFPYRKDLNRKQPVTAA